VGSETLEKCEERCGMRVTMRFTQLFVTPDRHFGSLD
jgi:hypothetical protein